MSTDGVEIPDLSWITNGWQAAVVIVLVLCVLVGPSVFAWMNTRKVAHEMKPNSGGSLRDAVDRVEQAQKDQHGETLERLGDLTARVTTLEQAAEKRRGILRWR